VKLVFGSLPAAGRIAVFPGAFHPPTAAHLGLAQAALPRVDTVVFTLPRAFPHKSYDDVGLDERLELLGTMIAGRSGLAVAVSEGGLFHEIARELRVLRPAIEAPLLLCGRDAAERIVGWAYPEHLPIERQLEEYHLLVAARAGAYVPPERLRSRIETLTADWDAISSSVVREAIRGGLDWRGEVPESIRADVERIYSRSRLDSKNARNR